MARGHRREEEVDDDEHAKGAGRADCEFLPTLLLDSRVVEFEAVVY
jgi:hypothetical protein